MLSIQGEKDGGFIPAQVQPGAGLVPKNRKVPKAKPFMYLQAIILGSQHSWKIYRYRIRWIIWLFFSTEILFFPYMFFIRWKSNLYVQKKFERSMSACACVLFWGGLGRGRQHCQLQPHWAHFWQGTTAHMENIKQHWSFTETTKNLLGFLLLFLILSFKKKSKQIQLVGLLFKRLVLRCSAF